MLRYMNVVNDEMERMRIARAARGFEATGIQHWRILANSAGALFIRSYERGERVHLAMIARGYNGQMPQEISAFQIRDWIVGAILPVSALMAYLITWAIGA
jgi:cobalt/nickel transport system permease protein